MPNNNFNLVVMHAARYLGGTLGSGYVRNRAKYTSADADGAQTAFWTPASGKRIIVMGYLFQCSDGTGNDAAFILEDGSGTDLSPQWIGQASGNQTVQVIETIIDLQTADETLRVELANFNLNTGAELDIEAWGFELTGNA